MAPQLKQQLDQAELRLKRLERMVKLITGLSTAIAILTAIGSGLLTYHQYRESVERARVSFSYTLLPALLPDGEHFYLKAKLKNLSTRELTVLGITARVWAGDKWKDTSKVASQTNDVILSDNLIDNCPLNLCTTEERGGVFRRRDSDDLDDMTLESTEGESELTLGPYPITDGQLKNGLWITGAAYVSETEGGSCTVYTKEVPPSGTFPYLCEEKYKDALGCYTKSQCSKAVSTAVFYELRKSDGSLQPR
jgi:hypothetical protein